MKCNHCGHENRLGAKFCSSCGLIINQDYKHNDEGSRYETTEQMHTQSDTQESFETKNESQNSKVGIWIIIGVFIFIAFIFFKSESVPSDQTVYNDTKYHLINGLKEKNVYASDISSQALTDIRRKKNQESKENTVFEVSGTVFGDYGESSRYVMLIVYEGKRIDSYEWKVDSVY